MGIHLEADKVVGGWLKVWGLLGVSCGVFGGYFWGLWELFLGFMGVIFEVYGFVDEINKCLMDKK